MIQRTINEDTGIVPGARLDTNVSVNEAMLRERPVRDSDGYGPKQTELELLPQIIG